MPPNPITIAIVDDNRLVREALMEMLTARTDMQVVTSSVADHAFLGATNPDVLLLDAGLCDHDSIELAAAIRKSSPAVRIVMMDLIPVEEEIVQFMNVGVSGFVVKSATFDEFVATLRAVAAGQQVFPARDAESLFARIARADPLRKDAHVDDVRMTPREREVIVLISDGLSNKEIAERLGIAAHTVKSHVRNVMETLALHTRLQIAAYARGQSPV